METLAQSETNAGQGASQEQLFQKAAAAPV
jgi:hypothetical protein